MTSSLQKPDATRVAGVFRDYLLVLDSIRNDLVFKENELNKILIGFYKIEEKSMNENRAKEYLMSLSKSLDQCNWQIASNNRKSILVDGQSQIAFLINLIKDTTIKLDVDTMSVIMDFWENTQYSLELFQILVDQFDRDIFTKIKMMYSGSTVSSQIQSISVTSDKVATFLGDIERFSKQLPDKISRCRLLIRSCGTHMSTHLLDKSSVADRLLVGINISQFPLLRVIPDLGFKLSQIFQICFKWLDREETFIHEMNYEIRQRRILAKEKESRIMSAREHQKDILKSVKASYLLCQNTKKRLKELVNEMKSLEDQIRETTFAQRNLSDEKMKTMSMSEFLNLSIAQTRKNYALQMKRQKLLNQVRQLETTLTEIDSQIYLLKQEIVFKSDERNKTSQKLASEEKTYHDAKSDLESYSQSLYNYKMELNALRQSLATMESLKLLKTSPEFIENISNSDSHQSQPVQLAPSLKNAIDRKIGQFVNKAL